MIVTGWRRSGGGEQVIGMEELAGAQGGHQYISSEVKKFQCIVVSRKMKINISSSVMDSEMLL